MPRSRIAGRMPKAVGAHRVLVSCIDDSRLLTSRAEINRSPLRNHKLAVSNPLTRSDVGSVAHASDRQVQIGHHMYPEVPLGDLVEAMLERAPQREKRNIELAPSSEPMTSARLWLQ